MRAVHWWPEADFSRLDLREVRHSGRAGESAATVRRDAIRIYRPVRQVRIANDAEAAADRTRLVVRVEVRS